MTRTLRAAARLLDRARRAAECASVASLSLAELRAAQVAAWDAYNADPEILTSGLMPWEEDVLGRTARAGQHVLVVGCGSGRDVWPLLECGVRVTGVDPSPVALDHLRSFAAERGHQVATIQGFIQDLPLEGPFDLIRFSHFAYTYITTRRRRHDVLRRLAPALSANGLIGINARPNHVVSPWYGRIGRASGALFRSDWRMEPGDVAWIDPGSGIPRFQHAFRAGELAAEFQAAGFSIVYRNAHALLGRWAAVSDRQRGDAADNADAVSAT